MSRVKSRRAVAAALLVALLDAEARGAEVEPLPEPLSLEAALSLADESHPRLALFSADLEHARAARLQAESLIGTRAYLTGRLRWIQPPEIAGDQSREDHAASLVIRKNLYDFGRSSALEAAGAAEIDGRDLLLRGEGEQRQIEVMERFFDVLLADLEFARDNEAMAVAYVTLDRLRNRNELGQASDIEVLEAESAYETVRTSRALSEAAQRSTRAKLALALGRPGQLPSSLVPPPLIDMLQRELPDYEALLKEAMESNLVVRAYQERLEAARQRVAAARAGGRPFLDGELEASTYTRELGSYDIWRAGIVLQVPLYSGGVVDAAVAQAQAALHKLQAEAREYEYSLQQQLLEAWLELHTAKVKRQQVDALENYRELYLDRSRAAYELELKTDLGDAMVRLTEAQLESARTGFREALAWAKLDFLTQSRAASPGQGTGETETAPGRKLE